MIDRALAKKVRRLGPTLMLQVYQGPNVSHSPAIAMRLDTITIAVMSVTLCVPIVVLLYVSWLSNRSERSLLWWSGSFFALMIAVVLYAPRDQIPDFLSIDLANAMVLASVSLALAAARSFDGRATPLWALVLAPVFWLAMCRIPQFVDYGGYRVAVFSALNAVLAAVIAFEYWRGRADRLTARHMLVVSFLLLMAIYVARIVMVMIMPVADPREYFHANLWTVFLMLGPVVISMSIAILVLAIVKERSEAMQRHRAEIDPLTGVPHRGGTLRQIQAMLSKGVPNGAAMLLFDLDFFKLINDQFGHPTGDSVLREFAAIAGAKLCDTDVFGRIGGEEFLAFLPGCDKALAVSVAERIRAALAGIRIEKDGVPVPATVSIGIAVTDKPVDDIDPLLIEADRALYAAKANGRNNVQYAVPKAA